MKKVTSDRKNNIVKKNKINSKFLKKKKVSIKKPLKNKIKGLILDISSICPHACIYCYHQNKGKSDNLIMKPEVFYPILDIIKKEGYNFVYPFMSGESFTNLYIYEYLGALSKKDFKIEIATRLGVKIDFNSLEESLKIITQQNTNLIFRIEFDAYDQESYNKVCKGDFSLVLKNIKELYKLSLKYKFKYYFQIVKVSYNELYIKDIKKKLLSIGIPNEKTKLVSKTLGYYKLNESDVDHNFIKNMMPKPQKKGRIKVSLDNKVVGCTKGCNFNWIPCISPVGNVILCCHDMLHVTNYGNIIEKGSLKKILSSEKYKKDVILAKKRRLPLCKGCN